MFSDDGDPVDDKLIREVMERLASLNGLLVNHLKIRPLGARVIF